MNDILDLDLGNTPPAPMETPVPAAENKEGEVNACAPAAASDESDDADDDGDANPAPAGGIQKATKIKYDPTAEPFVAGQCTITLALTIQPADGHPEGRLVVIGAKSHAETPIFVSARLNTLALPPALADLLAQYEASLPERGAKATAAKAQAEAKKKAEAEKKAQSEAERREQRQAKAAKRETKGEKCEVKGEKPKTLAQIEAEQKAAAKAELLAQAKAEAAQAAMF